MATLLAASLAASAAYKRKGRPFCSRLERDVTRPSTVARPALNSHPRCLIRAPTQFRDGYAIDHRRHAVPCRAVPVRAVFLRTAIRHRGREHR